VVIEGLMETVQLCLITERIHVIILMLTSESMVNLEVPNLITGIMKSSDTRF